MSIWVVLGLVLSHAALGAAVLYYRHEAQAQASVATSRAGELARALGDLDAAKTVAREQAARHGKESQVLNDVNESHVVILEDLARAHPDLADAILERVLQAAAARPASGADAPVPGPSTTATPTASG